MKKLLSALTTGMKPTKIHWDGSTARFPATPMMSRIRPGIRAVPMQGGILLTRL